MSELWPFRPLFAISETLEWLTEIIPSRVGEQRIALRSKPRQGFSYSCIFDAEKYMWAKAFTRRNGALEIDVPVWMERVPVGNIAASSMVIPMVPLYGDFRIGGKIAIWQDWKTYAVGVIDSYSDTEVTLENPIGTDFINALAMPVRECILTQGMRVERIPTAARAMFMFQVQDNVDLNELAGSYVDALDLYPQYQGIDVITSAPHASASIAENVIRTSEFIDSALGRVAVEPVYAYADFGQTLTFIEELGQPLWERRRWLHSLRGKQKAFWYPSYNRDLELQAPITSLGTTISVKSIGPTGFYIGRHIMFSLRDGSYFFRSITNAINVGELDTLTISSALGVDVALDQVLYVSFITKTRLNADRVTLDHRVPNNVSIVLPVSEVPE